LIPARGSGPVHADYANSSIVFDDRSNGSYWPVDDLAGSDPKPPVAFVQYMSADGKTFYLFSSGGDCLSVARGRLP
jgi:hypothetical protein